MRSGAEVISVAAVITDQSKKDLTEQVASLTREIHTLLTKRA